MAFSTYVQFNMILAHLQLATFAEVTKKETRKYCEVIPLFLANFNTHFSKKN